MLLNLYSLLSVAAILVCAVGIGRPLWQLFGLETDELAELAWSLITGLLAAILILLALGLTGLLLRPLLVVLTTAGFCWGLSELAQLYFSFRHRAARAQDVTAAEAVSPPDPHPPRWLTIALLGFASIAALFACLAALAPPTAGDALCYHLHLPKVFLHDAQLSLLPYDENATYPLGMEMLFLWALALDGGVAAQLLHAAMGLLLAAGTWLLAGPIVGRPWAVGAATFALLVPAISNQMTAPLNDLAVATFCTFAIVAMVAVMLRGESPRWFLVAGLMFGGALATKHTGLLALTATGLAFLGLAWRRPELRPTLRRGLVLMTLVALVVAAPWYARSYWRHGNPVYPFLSRTAHAAGFTPLKRPLPRHPISAAIAPWKLTFEPELFGGRGHQLGPFLLMAAPALLFVRRLRGLGLILSVAAVYLSLWFVLRQNLRFLLPLVPIGCVMLAWVWAELGRFPRAPSWLAQGALLCVLATGALIPVARLRDKWPVVLGVQSRHDYLLEAEPTYAAAVLANQLAPRESKILSQDYRGYYFEAPFVRESVYRHRTRYHRYAADAYCAPQFSAQLRRAGFTHLLLAESAGSMGIQFDPTLSQLVDRFESAPFADQRALLPLLEYQVADADGQNLRYRLIMLR